jgi:eukaryotic-like serine/threonine-protein kinase
MDVSLSPDGRRLAFVSYLGARQQLWVRSLDTVAAQPLAGTEGAAFPFWSPDGRYMGFFAPGSLKKIDVTGGPAQTLCEMSTTNGAGGSWSTDGVIIFASDFSGPLLKVPQSGGASSPLTTLDRSRGEKAHSFPQFLPDGRHFLYFATGAESGRVCVGSLDSKETKCPLNVDFPAAYAPPGYLLYERAGTLMAQAFDAKRLLATSDPVPIAEDTDTSRSVYSIRTPFGSISESGVLAYITGAGAQTEELQWFDRSGKKLGTVGQPGDYTNPALSPDGTRLAVGKADAGVGTRDLWIFDLKRGTASRFTSDPADELNPLWSRDGSRILFTSNLKGIRDIYQKAANGLRDSELVFESNDHGKAVNDWSPDGRYILYDTAGARASIWVLPLFGDRKPFPFVQGAYTAKSAQISPNGRYVAYASNESGRYEVYVQTFPEHSGKWQVSTAGGIDPEWRHDGKELFFIGGEKLMAVDVKTDGPQFEAGIPKPLFQAQFLLGAWRNRYVVTADGQRFLAIVPVEKQAYSPITVVMNWTADLKR